jgi:hypothetical protein
MGRLLDALLTTNGRLDYDVASHRFRWTCPGGCCVQLADSTEELETRLEEEAIHQFVRRYEKVRHD